MPRQTVKERIIEALDTVNPPRDTNAALLFSVHKWQEAKALAEANLKASWKAAQDAELVEADDTMRDRGAGTHIIIEQGRYSVTAKVSNPGARLDTEALGLYLTRKHGITLAQFTKALDACRKETAAPLEKRVLEA